MGDAFVVQELQAFQDLKGVDLYAEQRQKAGSAREPGRGTRSRRRSPSLPLPGMLTALTNSDVFLTKSNSYTIPIHAAFDKMISILFL